MSTKDALSGFRPLRGALPKIAPPKRERQPSTRCSVFSCEAEFKQEVKNDRAFIHDYLEAGWSYHYTPRGIRPVCPAHRILVDQSDAAV